MVLSKWLKAINNAGSFIADQCRALALRRPAPRRRWALATALIAFVAGSVPAQAGHHDIQCPGSQTLKLCRDGGNCGSMYPSYSTDTNDVLHFLGVSPGDQINFSVTNDSSAPATVDLTGQGGTNFSQILDQYRGEQHGDEHDAYGRGR